jgi:hypothetical protein
MMQALALSALLTLPVTPTQHAGVAAVQPQFPVRLQPAISRSLPRDRDREIVCGMVVIHKTPADDPKILLPARETDLAVRRIESQGCGAKTIVPAK